MYSEHVDDSVSEVSETDRIMFAVLSNPERIDMSAPPIPPRKDDEDGLPRIVEIENEDEDARHSDVEKHDEGEASYHGRHHREEERSRGEGHQEDDLRENYERHRRHHEDDDLRTEVPAEVPVRMPCVEEGAPVEHPVDDDDRRHSHHRSQEEDDDDHRGFSRHDEPDPQDEGLTKQSILLDLRRMEMQGVKLSREFTMDDRIEDLMLEARRHTLAMDEMSNVNMMRDGLRLAVTAIEMINNRIGLLDLDGWSTEVCRDLGKHDGNLCKIYRKYWKRSQSSNPEMDICMSMLGSMGMHHMKRSMTRNLMSGAGRRGGGGGGGGSAASGLPFGFGRRAASQQRPPPPPTAPPAASDDEEDLPP